MLKIIFLASLGLATGSAHSQTIVQLTEQIALDAEKLASIKGTLQEMYQGYADLKQGYTRLRDIVKDNFNLHEAFLDALWILSPAVMGDPRLTEIFNTEIRLVADYKAATSRLSGGAIWSPEELTYITGTFSTLLQRSLQAVEELTMLTTDNELRMSDAQRLTAIGRIDSEIKQELAFMERFDNELQIEAARRNQEANDINTLKSLYGLPN
jgi:AraC-like DNA-binding protein